jgi:hypothetical protein
MQKSYKLILDVFCEVYDLLKPWADAEFWDFGNHDIVPGAIYVVSRQEFIKHHTRIREAVKQNLAKFIYSNPHEGSETIANQLHQQIPIDDLVFEKKIIVIGGGDMDSRYPHLQFDSFLPKLHDYEENVSACARSPEIFTKTHKPYKFLFLNGRSRPHRKYLIERFRLDGLLDQALWTNLDSTLPKSRLINLWENHRNLLSQPGQIKTLDPKYEFDFYKNRVNLQFDVNYIKYNLFDNSWGEIYLNPDAYIDTYFSLVTETVFDYPHSFRTEKIWKPLVMGQPWIAVANQGYYRDMRNLGFRTFDHLIDESFDQIPGSQQRIERIAHVVEDLCRQDLVQFLAAAEETCKYNQQHYAEMRIKVRREFPDRFFQFVNKYFNE